MLLRSAIPRDWLDPLRTAFDVGERPSEQWPVPRGAGWRHAMVDLDPTIQEVCRLPHLLAAAGALIGERFFLSQVEGREPAPGYGHQPLHRDLHAQRPGDTVNVMVFFDDYEPENGATRFVPGTHREDLAAPSFDPNDETKTVHISGAAGDILVFDADLLLGASQNKNGARRRSILIGYFAEALYDTHLRTATLRNVRMDTQARFDASGKLV